jgi:large subunit ribosomal protein L4
MITAPIRNQAGKDVGEYKFNPDELASGINKQLLHDVVVMYEANTRVGSVKTKSRSEVEGTTHKMYRQKGTGRARAGSVRSPVRRGGGHAFAKVPLDWSYRLPKKSVQLATRMALLSKFLDNEVTVLDELSIDEPKTKIMAEILRSLDLSTTTCLLTIENHDPVIWKSARNLAGLGVSSAGDLNAYDLLHQKQLLVTKSAMDRLRNANGD